MVTNDFMEYPYLPEVKNNDTKQYIVYNIVLERRGEFLMVRRGMERMRKNFFLPEYPTLNYIL